MRRDPQVAARISSESLEWLESNFKSKSHGAEFILQLAISCMKDSTFFLTDKYDAIIKEALKGSRLLPFEVSVEYIMYKVEVMKNRPDKSIRNNIARHLNNASQLDLLVYLLKLGIKTGV